MLGTQGCQLPGDSCVGNNGSEKVKEASWKLFLKNDVFHQCQNLHTVMHSRSPAVQISGPRLFIGSLRSVSDFAAFHDGASPVPGRRSRGSQMLACSRSSCWENWDGRGVRASISRSLVSGLVQIRWQQVSRGIPDIRRYFPRLLLRRPWDSN